MLTFTDMFCGAGGSAIGLTEAGLLLCLAMNHWDRAIETHAANFRDADHWCEDVNRIDKRRLPATDILWASPICTEGSPAGRRGSRATHKAGRRTLEEGGHVAQAGFERTRATFADVMAATEVHRYKAVLVENVPEVASEWELFFWWVDGMRLLGYNAQYVSVSSAHVGGPDNPWAPQWRDRLYVVLTRVGIPLPDVDPHPLAWCRICAVDVAAVQAWKKPNAPRIGRYRAQYVYVCPNSRCKGAVVEPYVLPASSAIDWTDLGQVIGERARPLAVSTMRRIETGLRTFGRPALVRACGTDPDGSTHLRAWPADGTPFGTRMASNSDGIAVPPFVVNTNHDDDRLFPADARPLPTRSTRIGDLVVNPPMVVPSGGTRNTDPYDATVRPMRTLTATDGNAGAVVTPEAFVTVLRQNTAATSAAEPLMTLAAQGNHHYLTVPPGAHIDPTGPAGRGSGHGLVVPYYSTGKAKTAAAPLDTVTGRDRFGLVTGDTIRAVECRYRMIQPREALRAQRFPDAYTVTGNQGEQTMQAGNAVSANVAHWLGRQITAALDSRSAA